MPELNDTIVGEISENNTKEEVEEAAGMHLTSK